MKPYLRADLAKYGPEAGDTAPLSLKEARAYCRQLTREQYENFSVSHFLLPRELRQHFCNLYAYCRWADDLADEIVPQKESLKLLDWWESQVIALYGGNAPTHPVFIALVDTVHEFTLPRDPLLDLLSAFRQDQTKIRYATFEELLDYCRRSANPVGRLVLYLGRCHNQETARLSDSICTGLQLANFWQDFRRDWELGRIYLPLEDMATFGVDDKQQLARGGNLTFRALMNFEVDRAEEYLLAGEPLVKLVSPQLRVSVRLFIDGGLAILAAIRRQGYDVWSRRPVVSKWTKLGLLMRAFLRRTS
ncbi:MAG: squalene synthase HpnC [Pirellulaceae bacterium]